jgi:hypothetical protein
VPSWNLYSHKSEKPVFANLDYFPVVHDPGSMRQRQDRTADHFRYADFAVQPLADSVLSRGGRAYLPRGNYVGISTFEKTPSTFSSRRNLPIAEGIWLPEYPSTSERMLASKICFQSSSLSQSSGPHTKPEGLRSVMLSDGDDRDVTTE